MSNNNILEFGVADFSQTIKKHIETSFEYVAIKGEISGYRLHSSGHIYFKLKEGDFVLNAVCFKGKASKINFALENGLKVKATGKITTFGSRSEYQIIADSLELDGIGAMMMAVEKLKEKLILEGLFDEKYKKSIPFLSNIIGIITSPTGSVIEDMKHRIEARFPTNILLYPTLVQGNEAASQIIAGVQYFNNLSTNKPDLIIIARGGGSFEDLMPFNDEALIRAVFSSTIPVISAIGHEPDFTLLDFVADKRAPTPTAAAEIVTPERANLQEKITKAKEIINRVFINYLQNKHKDLQNLQEKQKSIVANFFTLQQQKLLKNTLPNLNHIFSKLQEKITHCKQIIANNLEKILQNKQAKLDKCKIDNNLIVLKINNLKQLLVETHNKITTKLDFHLERKQNLLQNNQKMLDSYHYENVLKRGFAIVYNEQEQAITNIATAKQQANLILQMQDGKILVKNEK